MKSFFPIVAALLLLLPPAAMADQHALISPFTAEKVRQLVRAGDSVRFFCQPCGDKTWKEQPVTHISLRSDSDYSEVVINGKGIDLAYTYILSDGQWTNLAMLLNLDTSGVSRTLDGASESRQAPDAASKKNGAEHPLDQWLTECMDKNPSTLGMNECLGTAYEKWDAELNRVYGELRKKLSPSQQEALKAAQVKWLQFRDAEFGLIEQFYSGFDGSMYKTMYMSDRMEIVRKRVLALQSYLDVLEEN